MARESVEGLAALSKALEEGSGDFLLDLVRKALGHIMNAEVTNLCQAETGERSPLRENSRNGYRDRDWETRLGSVDLQIPKLRKGSYFPCFLEPRRAWEHAFVNVVAEAVSFRQPCVVRFLSQFRPHNPYSGDCGGEVGAASTLRGQPGSVGSSRASILRGSLPRRRGSSGVRPGSRRGWLR